MLKRRTASAGFFSQSGTIKLTKSNGKDQVVNDRISKKCEELASSVIALAQEPSDSNIDLYKKKMRKLTHSKYIVSEILKVVNHSALQVQSLILRHECLMYVLT